MGFCITHLVLSNYNKISPLKNNFILTTQATLNLETSGTKYYIYYFNFFGR